MAALLVTADLMFSSKVAAAGLRSGMSCDTALGLEALWTKAAAGSPPLVILDLTTPGLDPARTVARLRGLAQPPRTIVAFGPHVQEAQLAAARDAGCDVVMPRGQFNSQLDEILKRYAGV